MYIWASWILKFIWKGKKKTTITKSILKEKNKVEGLPLDFKTYHIAVDTNMYGVSGR